jgi:hypothetical protein
MLDRPLGALFCAATAAEFVKRVGCGVHREPMPSIHRSACLRGPSNLNCRFAARRLTRTSNAWLTRQSQLTKLTSERDLHRDPPRYRQCDHFGSQRAERRNDPGSSEDQSSNYRLQMQSGSLGDKHDSLWLPISPILASPMAAMGKEPQRAAIERHRQLSSRLARTTTPSAKG